MTTPGHDPHPGDTDEQAPQVPEPVASPPVPEKPRHFFSAKQQTPEQQTPEPADEAEPLPEAFGRYRVIDALGKGGQGRVYRARDTQLNRNVAIKVTLASGLSTKAREALRKEAEILAKLEHRNILPVYDIGELPAENAGTGPEPGGLYVVSKLVDGSDLASRMKREPLPIDQALRVVAAIADALGHAHAQGLVHRDVKPGNILIDKDGTPYLADFGLALHETERPRGGGTPAYMSPEQAGNFGHLVKAQSDIYSLGVVLFELMTGRRPFMTNDSDELKALIAREPVMNPRQIRPSIPVELARICMKALEVKRRDRYDVAHDFAEEIRQYLGQNRQITATELAQPAVSRPSAGQTTGVSPSRGDIPPVTPRDTAPAISPPADSSLEAHTQVVPKGLRSFEAADSGFFLDLLPGPFDRDGLPASIRFWKTRVEEPNPGRVFRAGVIYGPSGCGKSSLVKAGLLPRLARPVTAIYREATPSDTEAELARDIRRALPDARGENLSELLADIRRRELVSPGGKLLIVLDQFEQWLHACADYAHAPLTRALRQTDGVTTAALLMVRDDFWPSITRFMQELEIPMQERHNCAMVDLFSTDHARHVLALFGKALGRLPGHDGEFSDDQNRFLDMAVAGLADGSLVVPVRLAVFAEMTKNRPWTPATLAQVGGIEGVGFTFLDENFGPRHAPLSHRPHLQAVQPLLAALLPAAGADIKGVRKTAAELRQAAGYEKRPNAFRQLVSILDTDLRLITPVDPVDPAELTEPEPVFETVAGKPGESDNPAFARTFADSPSTEEFSDTAAPTSPVSPGQVHEPALRDSARYQLTHDFLVPSLRQWLNFQKAGTREGRAWLKLEARSAVWAAAPENRQLPTLAEWISIRTRTESRQWSEPQRKMMRRAGRVHMVRSYGLSLLGLLLFAGLELRQTTRAQGLVRNLQTSAPAELPGIVRQIDADYSRVRDYLAPILARPARTFEENRELLHARLASVARDPFLAETLAQELLTAKEPYIQPIRDILKPFAAELTEKFKAILHDENAEASRRFRAGIVLAGWQPGTSTFSDTDFEMLATELVNSNAEFHVVLREALRPINTNLLPHLETIFTNDKASDAARLGAANSFADYVPADMSRLVDLLSFSDPQQFHVLYPLVAASLDPIRIPRLEKIVTGTSPDGMGTIQRMTFGQRRANAAIALLRIGERDKVLPVFDFTDDPEALSQFIFRCRDRGVSANELLDLFRLVNSVGIKLDRKQNLAVYAILLALGEFSLEQMKGEKTSLIGELTTLYGEHPSSAVHAASGWLLRKWGQREIIEKIDSKSVHYEPGREWFNIAISLEDESQRNPDSKLGSTNYTFVVFPAGEYMVGSPEDEPLHTADELRRKVKIERSFALCDREVTLGELIFFSDKFGKFSEEKSKSQMKTDEKPEPRFRDLKSAGTMVTWYDAVNFCRWLGARAKIPEIEQPYPDPVSLDADRYKRDPKVTDVPIEWPMDPGRRGFRLPREFEWEAAARSGVRTTFLFGSDPAMLSRFAWMRTNSDGKSHETRQLWPSVRGLFDLNGNVWEWTHDFYSPDLTHDGLTPVVFDNSVSHVLRGGCISDSQSYCRLSYRNKYIPELPISVHGFRIAITITDEPPNGKS